MTVNIRPVSKDNWRDLGKLQVRDDQQNFVAANIWSIAESQFGFDHPTEGHWDMFPYGIYDEDKPVGFLMIGYNYTHPRAQGFVIRLMVDERYQNQGYGRLGMNWILNHFRADDRIKNIEISYEPDNDVARKLYASLGFVETGEIFQGEVVAVLRMKG